MGVSSALFGLQEPHFLFALIDKVRMFELALNQLVFVIASRPPILPREFARHRVRATHNDTEKD